MFSFCRERRDTASRRKLNALMSLWRVSSPPAALYLEHHIISGPERGATFASRSLLAESIGT